MTTAVQRRRGTSTEHATFTGLDGEITVNTTTYTLHVHDGATVGGVALAKADGSNLVTSSIDINGGTIDGTVIGGSSAAAGSFTTISASGEIAANGGIALGDNDKATFGASDDLQIFHDGSNSWIKDTGTGNLKIPTSVFQVRNVADTESLIAAADGGAAYLYNAGSQKLQTTTTGIDVTGTVTADGLTVDGLARIQGTAVGLVINETDTTDLNSYLSVNGGVLRLFTVNDAFNSFANRVNVDNSTGDISFYEDTGTTAKFFWDASAESLGIGTSSPDAPLEVTTDYVFNNTGNGGIKVRNFSTTNYGTLSNVSGFRLFADSEYYGSSAHYADQTTSSGIIMLDGTLQFCTNTGLTASTPFTPTERARLDSSGNWLVGTTDSDMSNNSGSAKGFSVLSGGIITNAAVSNPVYYANRLTSDGSIIEFRKDGTTVGSIGTQTGYLTIGQSGATDAFLSFTGVTQAAIRPASSTGVNSDDTTDLGAASARFQDIYATNGTIQTSDANEKQDIDVLSEAEQRVAVAAKGLLRKFRWKSAVEEKGDDARIHFGIIAQDLQAAFEAEGLDAGRYGMFIHTTWWEHEVEVPAVEAQEAVYETVVTPATYDEEGNELTPETGEQVLVSEAVEGKEAYTRTDTYNTAEEAPEGAVERSRMGVRYSELLAFIIAAI